MEDEEINIPDIKDRITLEVARSITEEYLGGDPHKYVSDYVYIKPQSPIHGACDPWNAEQVYKLISRQDLIRNYSYSYSDGRFFYAYTKEECDKIKSAV